MTEGDSCRQKVTLFEFRFHSPDHKQQLRQAVKEGSMRGPLMGSWEEPFDRQMGRALDRQMGKAL